MPVGGRKRPEPMIPPARSRMESVSDSPRISLLSLANVQGPCSVMRSYLISFLPLRQVSGGRAARVTRPASSLVQNVHLHQFGNSEDKLKIFFRTALILFLTSCLLAQR